MPDNDTQNLQESLSHHEQQITDLSEMVTAQWHEIDRMKKQIQKLNDKLNAAQESMQDGGDKAMSVTEMAARDKPPHY